MFYNMRSRDAYRKAASLSRQDYKSLETWTYVQEAFVYDTADNKKVSPTQIQFATLIRSNYSNRVLTFGNRSTCLVTSITPLPDGVEPTLENAYLINAHGVYTNSIGLSPAVNFLYSRSYLQPLGIVFYNDVCTVVSNVIVDDVVFDSATYNTGCELMYIQDFHPLRGSIDEPISSSLVLVKGGQ